MVLECSYWYPSSFDTSMSQKSRFRMQMQGITTFRNSFPQLPWSIIENPKFIQTAHGYVFVLHFCGCSHSHTLNSNRLLTNGWWAYARKIVSYIWVIIGRMVVDDTHRTILLIGSNRCLGVLSWERPHPFPTFTVSSSLSYSCIVARGTLNGVRGSMGKTGRSTARLSHTSLFRASTRQSDFSWECVVRVTRTVLNISYCMSR